MTQILDPYEVFAEDDDFELGTACSLDPDDTCESCQ